MGKRHRHLGASREGLDFCWQLVHEEQDGELKSRCRPHLRRKKKTIGGLKKRASRIRQGSQNKCLPRILPKGPLPERDVPPKHRTLATFPSTVPKSNAVNQGVHDTDRPPPPGVSGVTLSSLVSVRDPSVAVDTRPNPAPIQIHQARRGLDGDPSLHLGIPSTRCQGSQPCPGMSSPPTYPVPSPSVAEPTVDFEESQAFTLAASPNERAAFRSGRPRRVKVSFEDSSKKFHEFTAIFNPQREKSFATRTMIMILNTKAIPWKPYARGYYTVAGFLQPTHYAYLSAKAPHIGINEAFPFKVAVLNQRFDDADICFGRSAVEHLAERYEDFKELLPSLCGDLCKYIHNSQESDDEATSQDVNLESALQPTPFLMPEALLDQSGMMPSPPLSHGTASESQFVLNAAPAQLASFNSNLPYSVRPMSSNPFSSPWTGYTNPFPPSPFGDQRGQLSSLIGVLSQQSLNLTPNFTHIEEQQPPSVGYLPMNPYSPSNLRSDML